MPVREAETSTGFREAPKLSILVYGAPGSGKTYLWTTAPKPYAIVTNEREVKSARLRQVEGPKFAVCDTFADIEEVVGGIYSGKYAKGYETIVLDHLTDATNMCIQQVKVENNASEMNLKLWGKVSERVTSLVRSLQGLQSYKHVIVVSQEQIDKDELRGEIIGLPNTVGRFASYVGGFFDFFLYAKQEVYFKDGKPVPEYKAYTIDLGRFKAADHLSVLGVSEPNDFQVILNKLQGVIKDARSTN